MCSPSSQHPQAASRKPPARGQTKSEPVEVSEVEAAGASDDTDGGRRNRMKARKWTEMYDSIPSFIKEEFEKAVWVLWVVTLFGVV